jgi:TFIIF-interacting CTD phosphatase-like protein
MSMPLLILDIDETLIYATEAPLAGSEPDFHVGPFSVYRRPHLGTFLEAVAAMFELGIWSSASENYVAGITALLFPDPSALRFVWSSSRCTRRYHPELQEAFYAKNLQKVRRLGYPLERVLMIDDSPEKLSQNFGNHIRINPFMGEPADTELRDLLPFLSWLRDSENVRKVEKRHWRQFRAADRAAT